MFFVAPGPPGDERWRLREDERSGEHRGLGRSSCSRLMLTQSESLRMCLPTGARALHTHKDTQTHAQGFIPTPAHTHTHENVRAITNHRHADTNTGLFPTQGCTHTHKTVLTNTQTQTHTGPQTHIHTKMFYPTPMHKYLHLLSMHTEAHMQRQRGTHIPTHSHTPPSAS